MYKKYDDDLYDPHGLKERFLENINEASLQTIKRVFQIAKPLEAQLNKDLCEFTKDQIELVIFESAPKTKQSARQIVAIVNSYINYAIENGHRATNINPLATTGKQYFKKFVTDSVQQHFTFDEIQEMITNCVNAQDAVLIALFFEGAYGKNHSELLRLKKSAINEDENTILVTDFDNSQRILKLSDRAISIVVKAACEKEYYKLNGTDTESRCPFFELQESDFVLKKSNIGKKGKSDMADINLILRRFAVLQEIFELPYLTATSVRYSGMIHEAWKIIQEREITRKDYIKIGVKFGVLKMKMIVQATIIICIDM